MLTFISSCKILLKESQTAPQFEAIPTLLKDEFNAHIDNGKIVLLQLNSCSGELCGDGLNSHIEKMYLNGPGISDSIIFIVRMPNHKLDSILSKKEKAHQFVVERETLIRYGIFSNRHAHLEIKNKKINKILTF